MDAEKFEGKMQSKMGVNDMQSSSNQSLNSQNIGTALNVSPDGVAELAALMQQYAQAKVERKRRKWAAIRAVLGLPFAIVLLLFAIAIMIVAAPFMLVSAAAGKIAAGIKWLALWCVGGYDAANGQNSL